MGRQLDLILACTDPGGRERETAHARALILPHDGANAGAIERHRYLMRSLGDALQNDLEAGVVRGSGGKMVHLQDLLHGLWADDCAEKILLLAVA